MREKGGVGVGRDVHAGGSCACCGGQITEVGHVAEIVEGSVERLTKVDRLMQRRRPKNDGEAGLQYQGLALYS